MQDQDLRDMLAQAAKALPAEAHTRARSHQMKAALGEGQSLPNLRTLAEVADTVGYTVFVLYMPKAGHDANQDADNPGVPVDAAS